MKNEEVNKEISLLLERLSYVDEALTQAQDQTEILYNDLHRILKLLSQEEKNNEKNTKK